MLEIQAKKNINEQLQKQALESIEQHKTAERQIQIKKIMGDKEKAPIKGKLSQITENSQLEDNSQEDPDEAKK